MLVTFSQGTWRAILANVGCSSIATDWTRRRKRNVEPTGSSTISVMTFGLRREGVRGCARECRKMFAMFRQLRAFSMPWKAAHLPSAERSRGRAGRPRAKQFMSAYESAVRFRSDVELSEEQHDLPTFARTSPNPSTGRA